jgi:hypothetical protein
VIEAEWLACDEPELMLDCLWGKASDRKLRLFSVACCRHVWPSMRDERFRNAVLAAELFADSKIDQEELRQVRQAAVQASVQLSGNDEALAVAAVAISVAAIPAPTDPVGPAVVTARHVGYAAAQEQGQLTPIGSAARMAEPRRQSWNLRDIFGDPFRPVAAHHSWLRWNNATVVELARTIYDDRAFDRMPLGPADRLCNHGISCRAEQGHFSLGPGV